MAEFDYDLFTIGAGSGGVRGSRMAARYGARVAVAEEYRVGGTCVIRGCVPKKLLVYAAEYGEVLKDAAGYGWSVGTPAFDWRKLLAGKDREIDRLESVYQKNLDGSGVEVIRSRAVLEDAHTVRLIDEHRSVRAKHILIATGASPYVDKAVEGWEYAITSNEAFHLDALPESVLVLGGGYIAVEFAGIFHGLGVKTHLMYRGEKLLRGFDEDLRDALHEAYTHKGIDIITRTIVRAIRPSGNKYVCELSDGRELEVGLVMFAIGRKPNIEGLGLERAGVEVTRGGAIAVDAHSRTSVPSIYAVGDVTDRVNLTPVAIREGAAFAETVFNANPTVVDHSLIPTAVFSQPEMGTVGLTEGQAEAAGHDVHVYLSRFRPMHHVLPGNEQRMLMKLVVDGTTDRVLGVHLFGPHAGEMIQLAGIAVKMKATKADFDATVAVHPTAAEELVTMKEPTRRARAGAA